MSAADAMLTDASVVSVLLREFSRLPVLEQAKLKAQLEGIVRAAIGLLPEANRIVLQAPDGLGIVVLGSAASALALAERVQASDAGLPLCIGLNHGPVKPGGDAKVAPALMGDGIVASMTLARLATRGKLLASRSFRDALEAVAPHRAAVFAPVGAFTDANVRTHELFTPDPHAGAARNRRILILGGIGVSGILAAGAITRVARSYARRPAVLIFDIAPLGAIYIDGEHKGVSPPLRVLEMPPGAYTIEVRNSSNPPLKLTVNLKPAEEMTVSHSFAAPRIIVAPRKRAAREESFVDQLRRKLGN